MAALKNIPLADKDLFAAACWDYEVRLETILRRPALAWLAYSSRYPADAVETCAVNPTAPSPRNDDQTCVQPLAETAD
jgi:hypothetical protein